MPNETNNNQNPAATPPQPSRSNGYLVFVIVLLVGLVVGLSLYYAIVKGTQRTNDLEQPISTPNEPTDEFDESKVEELFETVNREMVPAEGEDSSAGAGEVEIKSEADLFTGATLDADATAPTTTATEPELLFQKLKVPVSSNLDGE